MDFLAKTLKLSVRGPGDIHVRSPPLGTHKDTAGRRIVGSRSLATDIYFEMRVSSMWGRGRRFLRGHHEKDGLSKDGKVRKWGVMAVQINQTALEGPQAK